MKFNRLIAPGVLGAAALLSPLAAHGTFAHASVCRTDPLVTFTNGQYVRLWASTNTDPSNVSLVTYNLQVPAKWTVKSITYDNVAPEKVNLTFNQQAGSYILTARVGSANSVTTDVWIAGNNSDSQGQDGPTNTWLTLDWSN